MSHITSISRLVPNSFLPGSFEAATTYTKKNSPRIYTERIPLTEEILTNLGPGIVRDSIRGIGRIRAIWGNGKTVRGLLSKEISGGTYLGISPDGIGLTNKHVTDDLQEAGHQLYIDFPFIGDPPVHANIQGVNIESEDTHNNGTDNKIKVFSVPAVELVSSPQDDLALVAIALPETKDPWPYLSFNPDELKFHELTYTIGHYDALKYPTLTAGGVLTSSYNLILPGLPKDLEEKEERENVQALSFIRKFLENQIETNWKTAKKQKPKLNSIITTNKVGPGNSGGPLLNSSGKISGVTFGGFPRFWQRINEAFLRFIYKNPLRGEEPPFDIRSYNISFHLGLEKRVFPFLKDLCKLNPEEIMQNTPARVSNLVERLFKRKVNS